MKNNELYTFNVRETFETMVEVRAASLDEAETLIRGRVGSVRALSDTLEEATCRVVDASSHPAKVEYILTKLIKVPA